MTRLSLLAATAVVFFASGVPEVSAADEFAIKLKPGPGSDAAQTRCSACHSLDYILMNSPFQSEKTWTAEVTKMINVFGADIPPDEAKTITDYLSKNYGAE